MRHAGRLAYSKCKESVGPSLFSTQPQLDILLPGLCIWPPLHSTFTHRHTPLRGQWPHTPKGILFLRGWAEPGDGGSESQPGCPMAEPPPSSPTIKAQNSDRECVCWGRWGDLLGPGPEAWQADESSILEPRGARQVCGEDAHPGSWS